MWPVSLLRWPALKVKENSVTARRSVPTTLGGTAMRLAVVGNAEHKAAYERLAPRVGVEICASGAADAIVVEETSDSAENACRQAIAAGKHLLLASPQALTLPALGQLATFAEAAQVRFLWGRTFRFSPAVKTLHDTLASGKLGELALLRLHHWEPQAGGSALAGLVTHVNLVCSFFGAAPSHVYAQGRESGYVQFHLGFAGGGMALVDYATVAERDDYF